MICGKLWVRVLHALPSFPFVGNNTTPTIRTNLTTIMRLVGWMTLLFSCTTAMKPSSNPKIAIVGSGAAGLAACRIWKRQVPHCQVTVLEQQERLGGVWKYNSQSKQSSTNVNPMYQGLRTNLPKELMQFREFPWTDDMVVTASKEQEDYGCRWAGGCRCHLNLNSKPYH